MKQETPTVEARPREKVGSTYARRLRKAGRLPAIIYGHKIINKKMTSDPRLRQGIGKIMKSLNLG